MTVIHSERLSNAEGVAANIVSTIMSRCHRPRATTSSFEHYALQVECSACQSLF
jgi:hypothetical protein